MSIGYRIVQVFNENRFHSSFRQLDPGLSAISQFYAFLHSYLPASKEQTFSKIPIAPHVQSIASHCSLRCRPPETVPTHSQ